MGLHKLEFENIRLAEVEVGENNFPIYRKELKKEKD